MKRRNGRILEMTKNKQVSIKITGDKTCVLEALNKIESVFPLAVRSKIYPNQDGSEGIHVWVAAVTEGAK